MRFLTLTARKEIMQMRFLTLTAWKEVMLMKGYGKVMVG